MKEKSKKNKIQPDKIYFILAGDDLKLLGQPLEPSTPTARYLQKKLLTYKSSINMSQVDKRKAS